MPTQSSCVVQMTTTATTLLSRRNRQPEKLLRLIEAFHLNAGVRNTIADNIDAIIRQPEAIAPYLVTMSQTQVQALCETLFEAGVQVINDTHHPTLIVLWNNQTDKNITYRYSDAYLHFGMLKEHHFQNGEMPKYMAINISKYGYQYLEMMQSTRRNIDSSFTFTADDLRLPLRIFQLRKAHPENADINAKLDAIVDLIIVGDIAIAEQQLNDLLR